jgi:glutamate-1-semialdehyde 2,1-aminomutase
VAALAGRSDIMSALSGGRILHYGTQNANPLLLAVVRRSLDLLTADGNLVFARLDQLAQRLVTGLREAIARTGAPAIVQNVGAMLQVYFLREGHESVESITGARDFGAYVDMETFNRFAHLLFAQGVYLSPSPALHSVLSTVHTEAHVDRIVVAAGEAFAQIADQTR